MNIPEELKYTQEHEWVKINDDGTAYVGITDFAQSELGDIVYVEVDTQGNELDRDAIFGTVEAVKTVSDLFMPISGTVEDVNEELADNPELINKDPYDAGWMIKITISNEKELDLLLDAEAYKKLVG